MGDRREMLGHEPLLPLLMRLSLPAMTGMFVMASYNVVDTIFVGWGVGPLGIAATAAAFPLQFFVNAIAMWSAMGTASLSSRLLGAGDQEGAERALGNGFLLSCLFGLATLIGGQILLRQLIALTGTDGAIQPLTEDYLRIAFLGNPVILIAMLFNNTIRAEGNTRYAMMSMVYPAVLNCILDPLFIFGFHMGVKGAAWATVTGQVVMGAWNLRYYLSGNRSLIALRRDRLAFRRRFVREILAVGSSEFARMSAVCVSIGLLMNQLSHYGTPLHIAAYGIMSKVISLATMPIFGIGQGLQPIVGYCYGAGLYSRARKATEVALLASTAITVTGEALIMAFPQYAVLGFTDDPELIRLTVWTVRIALLGFFALGFQIIGTITFQALGFAGPALFLSLSRQVVFLIPAMIILPRIFGIAGVFYTYPFTDIVAAAVTLLMLLRYRRRFARMERESRNQP